MASKVPRNILTVDVEDWYHICDIEHILPRSSWNQYESRILANIEKILTLLSRFGVKATFFVLGFVAERTPEVVKMIYGEGHEIASHGYGHIQVYKQGKEEFVQDLLRSKSLIEGIIGREGEKVDNESRIIEEEMNTRGEEGKTKRRAAEEKRRREEEKTRRREEEKTEKRGEEERE